MVNRFTAILIGFTVFYCIGVGVNKLEIARAETKAETIKEDCTYKVSSNGVVHDKTSPYYDVTNFEVDLCKCEAEIIASQIKQAKFNY